jgi:hypothetical protein
VNVPGKSPSVWRLRLAVVTGAIAVLAPVMTPVCAAHSNKKATAAIRKKPVPPHPAGGGSGLLSLEWTIGAMFRP